MPTSDVSFAVLKGKEIGFALHKEALYTNKVKLFEENLRRNIDSTIEVLISEYLQLIRACWLSLRRQ